MALCHAIYYVIYTVIMTVQICYCLCGRRAVFLANPQEAIMQLYLVAVYQNLEELLKRQLRLIHIELEVGIIRSHKSISKIPGLLGKQIIRHLMPH